MSWEKLLKEDSSRKDESFKLMKVLEEFAQNLEDLGNLYVKLDQSIPQENKVMAQEEMADMASALLNMVKARVNLSRVLYLQEEHR